MADLPLEECCKLIQNYLYTYKEGEGERKLIDLVLTMDEEKRLKVAQAYKHLYSEEGIFEDIKEKVDSPKYAECLIALFTPRVDYCCEMIKKRLKYFLSEEDDVIFETICGSPAWLIEAIQLKYPEKYGITLQDELTAAYSGEVRENLLTLLKTQRNVNEEPNERDCERLAKQLQNTPVEEWGTNKDIFDKIFAVKSPHELVLIGRIYFENVGKTLITEVEENMSGKMRILFKELLFAVINPSEIYAEKLRKAMKIEGVDCYHLGRIIVQRFEIDMPYIKKFYQKLYGVKLEDDIDQATTGFYAIILLALVNKVK